jgi:hypothetical protein
MITKKLFLFLLFLAIIAGGISCLGEGENKSSASSVAVVDYNPNMGGYVMNLPAVVFAAPELASKLKVGDCIRADFTINYSNQPSLDYYTATEIRYQKLNNWQVKEESGDMIDGYNEAIRSITLSVSPNYNGNVFLEINREETNNHVYNYELILNPDSIDEKGIPSVFLKSQKLDNTAGSSTYYDLETFNLQSLFEKYGQDSIYQEGSFEQRYRYVSLNFMYQSEVKEEIPVYSRYGNNPVDILVFN